MKNKKKLKGEKMYVNDHLTKKSAMLYKKARELRSQNTIAGTWTSNCLIKVKCIGVDGKILTSHSMRDLQKFG